jgi:BASS family bile acid:Na+ symporter
MNKNCMGLVSGRFIPSGPTLLVVGVSTGLVFPPLADAMRPFMSATIFTFVLGTLLRLDMRQFAHVAKKPYVSVVLPILAMVICPALMVFATRCSGLDPELSFAMVVAVAAPPSSGTAAVARMLGLNASVPLAATLVSMVVAPFSVAMISMWFGGISLDPMTLALRLTTIVGSAVLVALVLRSCASPQLHRRGVAIDRIVLFGLLVFAVATMAGARRQIVDQPMTALACVALAFGSNIALQAFGAISTSGTRAERLTAGLVLGNRNVGLVWSAMGSAVSPRMALFFAATQFPIYILPRLLEAFLRPANKDRIHHDHDRIDP